MIQEHTVLDPQKVTLRHIKLGTQSSPGAVAVPAVSSVEKELAETYGEPLPGPYYYPDPVGLNGKEGFQSGNYEKKMSEEGAFTIVLPNTVGPDGELHRDRLAVLDEDTYRPGDEYIEIWRENVLEFVGVPVSYTITKASISISGFTPFWLLKKIRETATGYWCHSPRDAMENYLTLWQFVYGMDATLGLYSWAYETGTKKSEDGRWVYQRAESQDDGIHLIAPTGTAAQIQEAGLLPIPQYGPGSTGPHLGWRWEIDLNIKALSGANKIILCDNGSATSPKVVVEANGVTIRDNNSNNEKVLFPVTLGEHKIAVEFRDRWLYYFFDGKLIGYFKTVQIPNTIPWAPVFLEPTGGPQMEAVVYGILFRRQRRFLNSATDPGDYKLPGAPPPGGLEGHYHNDADIWNSVTNEPSAGYFPVKVGRLLHPLREVDPGSGASGGLYQRRLDKSITFTAGSWEPTPVPNGGEKLSVRWVGAIYLDLDNHDYALKCTGAEDGFRIWVGKTRAGEHYLTSFGAKGNEWELGATGAVSEEGPWLKAGSASNLAPVGASGVLAGQGSGWYPICIEAFNNAGQMEAYFQVSRDSAVNVWASLADEGQIQLSPYGLYQDNVAFDSHYDAFKNIADSFGYQWTENFASLESGQFPGWVAPKARVGRDTDFILDDLEGSEASVQGNADDVADSLLVEAQGLGDPSQATQLTAEILNIPELVGKMFVTQEQESLSDINNERLLLQRARAILALREEPWEEVGARPRGTRKLADSFPLTGALAEFKWAVGDGLRLVFPEVKVEDKTPRQIMGINQPFVPDGLGAPTASFRQRPRNLVLVLRKMLKDVIAAKRSYQGQIVAFNGSLGGSGGVDGESRVSLPVNINKVISVVVNVTSKSNTSAMQLTVNGTATGIKVTSTGRVDVTAFLAPDASNNRIRAGVIEGTGTVTIQLELLVSV